jgi:hypothetical protein
MAKSKNEDDGWDEFEREFYKVKNDVATPAKQTRVSNDKQAGLIKALASKITGLWFTSTAAIIHVAAACAEADRRLAQAQKKFLLEKLPFGASTFSKLVQIGKDPHIRKNIKSLPPSYSTIYVVSQLSEKDRNQGIDTGMIHADATRIEIENFRDTVRPAAKAGTQQPGKRPGAAAKAPDSGRRSERETSEPQDDEFLEDEEFLEDDQQDDPEPSAESADVYDSLAVKWKAHGLPRSDWLATPKEIREQFYTVLRREPFEPRA